MSNGFFSQDIIDKEADSFLFRKLKLERVRNDNIRRRDKDWVKGGHKIYPSDLRWGMCPYEYIKSLANNSTYPADADSLELMAEGTYKHREVQDVAKAVKGLLWHETPQNVHENVSKKLDHCAIEIPVFDPESGISGMVDFVLNFDGFPGVVDFKTTQIVDDNWKKRFPTEAQLTQIAIYEHIIESRGYFSLPLRTGGLAYLNLCYPPKSARRKFEFYRPLTDEIKEMSIYLVKELTKERMCYINKEDSHCTYQLCRTHQGV